MTPPERSAQDILGGEILAEAQREADALLERARAEARALAAKAAEEAEQARMVRRQQTRTLIERRDGVARAAVGVEIERLRSARVEAILQTIHDDALQRLFAREGVDTRAMLTALAAEAVRVMEGEQFDIQVAAADRAVLDDAWPGEVLQLAGRPGAEIRISEAGDGGAPGPVIRAAAGRQVWDNRLASRLERLWPELRRMIAEQTSLLETKEAPEARP